MRSSLNIVALILIAPLLCGAALVVGFVVFVGLTVPQLPAWAQPGVVQWMMDVPQNSESSDNGSSSAAGITAVPWEDYEGLYLDAEIYGIPLWGPIEHWSNTHEKPLLGCVFHDPRYSSHTGADFPVNIGTPLHTTLAGKVDWAGANGPWGNLVVVENNGYQIWLAHLDSVSVVEGQILEYGDIVGLSGNTGNSTGPHLHYGIKHKTEAGSFVWLNPQYFFSEDEYIYIGCSD